jgi:hypothetical protein
MVDVVSIIANSVIREAALPDFSLAAKDGSEGMGVPTFDELNGVFERFVIGGCE